MFVFVIAGVTYSFALSTVSPFTNPSTLTFNSGVSPYVIVSPSYVAVNVAFSISNVVSISPT